MEGEGYEDILPFAPLDFFTLSLMRIFPFSLSGDGSDSPGSSYRTQNCINYSTTPQYWTKID